MIAIDTNVLIYAIDLEDLTKHDQANALLDGLATVDEECVCPWQVACELLAFLRRQQSLLLMSRETVVEVIGRVLNTYPLTCPSPATFASAVDLHQRYSLSHWDSLLLAACVDAGVDTLYSEDMSDGMTYDSVTVINPFKNP